MKCIRSFVFSWLSASLLLPSIGLSAPKANPLPPLLQEIEAKYAKAKTLEAEFSQVIHVIALDQKKKSSGVIMVKRPNKLRWQTNQPDPNLLVSDGKTFWFYTPPFDETEHGQLIERKTAKIQSRLANALLSGSFSVAKDMKIKKQGASTFILIPKPGTAGTVTRAKIQIDKNEKLIKKVILEHKGGNRDEITLSRIRLGNQLGDDIFVFVPPENTDRVKD